MKKIACLFVAVLFATLFGHAQTDVVVGEDGNNYTDYLPFYFYAPYSYTQTVYLAEELLPGDCFPAYLLSMPLQGFGAVQ